MSGKPNRLPTDAERFRKDYLANLDLEIANNDKNLQANLLHKRTGQIASQITDYRTTTEKLADTTALRAELRKQFRRIADVSNANRAVDEMGVRDIEFASQNIEKIVADLRPRYKYGVPAEALIAYIMELGEHTERFGLLLSPDARVLVEVGNLINQLPDKQDLNNLRQTIQRNMEAGREQNTEIARAVLDRIKNIDMMIDGTADLLVEIQNRRETLDAQQLRAVEQIILNATQDLPTQHQLTDLMVRLDQMRGDADQQKAILLEMAQILSTVPENQDEIDEALGALRAQVKTEGERTRQQNVLLQRGVNRGIATQLQEIEERFGRRLSALEMRIARAYIAKGASQAEVVDAVAKGEPVKAEAEPIEEAEVVRRARPSSSASVFSSILSKPVAGEQPKKGAKTIPEAFGGLPPSLPKPQDPSTLRDVSSVVRLREVLGPYIVELEQRGVEPPKNESAQYYKSWHKRNFQAIKDLYEEREEAIRTSKPVAKPVGTGLRRKVRGRGIKNVDETLGVKEELKFAPFGRYFINLVKLNDDIICLCKKNGSNISDCKTKRLSIALAKVIRKIVNGGKPTYDELASLNEEDKLHYGEYMRKSHIVGEGLEVPKMDDRTDLNQFEIMKGEILSGNDSTELIKKFKVLVMKLVHNGRLPKGQAKELLMDLASLGY